MKMYHSFPNLVSFYYGKILNLVAWAIGTIDACEAVSRLNRSAVLTFPTLIFPVSLFYMSMSAESLPSLEFYSQIHQELGF